MKQKVFKYLKSYSTQPIDVDRLIVSAFLKINKIEVKNNLFLKSYIISNKLELENLNSFISIIEKELITLNIEQLIELFEFVISPSDKIINGAIYTPLNIRNYITEKAIKTKKTNLLNSKIADISCGCGGFLLTVSKKIKRITKCSYSEIFKNNIFGIDIQKYSINRTEILLSILALSEGEDKKEFQFNLFTGDTLTFEWNKKIKNFSGFDIVLGNPPYVSGRNLTKETKLNLKNWEVCNSGNPDLYIPFFQIGLENLSENGILGYITMNTFFKSLNGRSLRKYFQDKKFKFKIIDFGAEQIFKAKNTYTCICLIEKSTKNYIKYFKCENKKLPQLERVFSKIQYSKLDAKTGWNLQDNEVISKIEATGVPFGNLFKTRHGIATLKNDIYIFKPVKEDKEFYYLQNGSLYPIEKGICRDIVNSNKLSRSISLKNLKEKVIFPYDSKINPKLLKEKYLKDNYPKAYTYFQNKRKALSKRDKGDGNYENWFAFGRTQSLEQVKNKMFFPKMSDRTPSYIINSDNNLLFYNGQAIIGHNRDEMQLIKKLMETKLFWYYIKTTSKPYASNYYSLNGNYIRNFGICELNSNEIDFVLKENNRQILDNFFEEKYDVEIK